MALLRLLLVSKTKCSWDVIVSNVSFVMTEETISYILPHAYYFTIDFYIMHILKKA